MNPDVVVEYGQEAALNSLTLIAPLLIVGILVAIVLGIMQSMTQIQDQTVSFVPKIVLIVLTFVLCLPWMTGRLVEYSKQLFEKPHLINVGSSESTMRSARESAAPNDKVARMKIR